MPPLSRTLWFLCLLWGTYIESFAQETSAHKDLTRFVSQLQSIQSYKEDFNKDTELFAFYNSFKKEAIKAMEEILEEKNIKNIHTVAFITFRLYKHYERSDNTKKT